MTQYPLGLRIVTPLSDVKKIHGKPAGMEKCVDFRRTNGHRH